MAKRNQGTGKSATDRATGQSGQAQQSPTTQDGSPQETDTSQVPNTNPNSPKQEQDSEQKSPPQVETLEETPSSESGENQNDDVNTEKIIYQRIYVDTEFMEDGKTIDLLSIGLVREDGAEYYAEVEGVDISKANDWVRDNVLPKLTGDTKPREQIAAEIIEFVGENPEFWGYFADYDWVAICQLYGAMVDLPKSWPMYCNDLKQLATVFYAVFPLQDQGEHNALDDARWVRSAHQAWRESLSEPGLPSIEPLPDSVDTDDLSDIGFEDVGVLDLPLPVAMMLLAAILRKSGVKGIPNDIVRKMPKTIRVGSDVFGLGTSGAGQVVLTELAGAADNQTIRMNVQQHEAALGKCQLRYENALRQKDSLANALARRKADSESVKQTLSANVEEEYLRQIGQADEEVNRYKKDVDKEADVVAKLKAQIVDESTKRTYVFDIEQVVVSLGGLVDATGNFGL